MLLFIEISDLDYQIKDVFSYYYWYIDEFFNERIVVVNVTEVKYIQACIVPKILYQI